LGSTQQCKTRKKKIPPEELADKIDENEIIKVELLSSFRAARDGKWKSNWIYEFHQDVVSLPVFLTGSIWIDIRFEGLQKWMGNQEQKTKKFYL
jgi:RNA-binding protein YhbY